MDQKIKEISDIIVGKTIEEASKLIPEYTIRTVIIDGNYLMTTKDYKLDRVNVSIEKGVIVGVSNIG